MKYTILHINKQTKILLLDLMVRINLRCFIIYYIKLTYFMPFILKTKNIESYMHFNAIAGGNLKKPVPY